jgi:hypothetical protein
MTKAEAKKLLALTTKIEILVSRALDVIDDDPMRGDVWTALNNVSAGAQWARQEVRKELDNL